LSRADRRRGQILAAASRAFQSAGYAQTTMDQIAAAAGVAKGSLYNYFESKQALFLSLFSEAMAPVLAETDEVVAAGGSAADRLCRIVDLWFKDFEYFRGMGGLMLEFWATGARQERAGNINDVMRSMYREHQDRMTEIISQGMAAGEFRRMDARWAASAVMALLDGLLVQSILDMGVVVDAGFVEALKRGLLASLGVSPGAPAAP